MNVSELDLSDGAIKFLKSLGYKDLYPPQAQSIKAGLLEGNSMLVCAPTASGKTLIALLGILGCIERSGKKAIYLSPLRALASEKYEELKGLENATIGGRKIRVDITTGDYEMSRKDFETADIMIMTNERLDSLIRRRPPWLERVGFVVSDEIHLLGDASRGPALEMVLSHIKSTPQHPQILGLSATVSNAVEIAAWLDAELVTSQWRPVPLIEGVYDGQTLYMDDDTKRELNSTSVRGAAVDIGLDCVAEGGQTLVFANTRVNSASIATKASTGVKNIMGRKHDKRRKDAAKKIIRENERTETVMKLAKLVESGVAFHHAGLSSSCRNIVESEFRSGAIRLVATTPTLAAGVNLPARRIVISSIMRYDARVGIMAPISVLEYKQMSGRAGRPQYDNLGESVIITTKGPAAAAQRYIGAEPEPVMSCMADPRSMRIHTLGLLVMRPPSTRAQITDFFMQTLAGEQTDAQSMRKEVGAALRFLVHEGLATSSSAKSTKYAPSAFGQLVSSLYLDPQTAIDFGHLADMLPRSLKQNHTLGLLCAITVCSEFYPKLSLRAKDSEAADEIFLDHQGELFEHMDESEVDRSALALSEWVSEAPESRIASRLGIESGDIRRITERASWLAYCMASIARHKGHRALARDANMLQTRISYGVLAELADLVRLRGIGRVRARRLYMAGFRNRKLLADAPVEKIAEVRTLTRTLATSIKSQIGDSP